MTLFRKVFQNQSQPASTDGELDSAALRRAITETQDQVSPLRLDPFAQPSATVSDADWRGSAGADDLQDEDFDPHEAEFEGEETWPTSAEVDEDGDASVRDADGDVTTETVADESLWDAPETPADAADTVDETDSAEGDGFPSEEEFAARLGRALAETQVAAEPDEVEDCREPSLTGWAQPELDNLAPVDEAEGDEEEDHETSAPDTRTTHSTQAKLTTPAAGPLQSAGAETPTLDLSTLSGLDAVPAPAPGRAAVRAGRVKTRLLGFNRTGDTEHDPFGQAPGATASAQSEKYPVGWLVIVEGPGVGHSFSIFTGASMIGRGEDQVIRLDFGDNSISRQNHAAIAYDEEQNKFYIGHGGKSNIIRRNARPVLATEELHHADLIRIGETTLRFVALCGSDFQWNAAGGAHDASR